MKLKTLRSSLNMTSGNIFGLIVRFALPVFVSQIFQQLYNTADTLIVGNFLGAEAMAAVSASGNLIFLMNSFFLGLSNGAGIIISKYFGARDKNNLSKAVHTDIAFGLIFGVFLSVAGIILTPILLQWMQTDPVVLPKAIEYFRFYFFGAIAVVMYNTCSGILNAVGDSTRPLIYLIISSVTNIVLDIVFICICGFGVWSAAVATVISQLLTVILCARHLLKPGNDFSVSIRKIRLHRSILSQIIRYGLPTGIQNSVISIANVLVQTQVNMFGAMATAGFGAYCKIEGFVFVPIMSFSMATSTFISQNLGAKEYARAKKGALFGILVPSILSGLIGLILYTIAPYVIALFNSDLGVLQYGVLHCKTVSLFYFLLGFSHSVAAVCRGSGKTIVPMIIMLSIWCIFRITFILVMMHFFRNIQLVYACYPVTWGLSSIVYLFYFIFSDWVHGFEKRPVQ